MIIYLIHSIICIALIYFLFRKWKTKPLHSFFLPGLIYKAGLGIILGILFWHYFQPGDTTLYHQEAITFTDLFKDSPSKYLYSLFGSSNSEFDQTLIYNSQPRALLFAKILSGVYLLTNNNYWIASIYFSLFSFIGVFLMANEITRLNQAFKWPSVIAFLLFPSIVFWSSGVIKESLAMGVIGLIVYLTLSKWTTTTRSILKGVFLVLLFYFLWSIKYYYAAVLIPAWGILFSEYTLKLNLNKWLYLLIIPVLVVVSFLHPNLNPNRIWGVIVQNHDALIQMSSGENYIHFWDLSTNYISMLLNIPIALIFGWFGPIGSFSNLLTSLASIENLVLLAIMLWGLAKSKGYSYHGHLALFLSIGFFIVIETLLVSFSTPVYGTLLRYKVVYQCFLIWIILVNHPISLKLLNKFS